MLARARRALRRRADLARHRGDAVCCPVCGSRFDRFKPDWNRADAVCWSCGAHERHRALALVLDAQPQLLDGARSLLHFAPEWCLRRRLGSLTQLRYVTADLDPAKGELQLDLLDLALPDACFDAVLCLHVLEHVQDDRAAMGELRRVTAPGGWAIVMVPLDLERASTYEDASIRDPQARRRAFWQHDHLRLYAPDVAERLRAAGFEVEPIHVAADAGPAAARRHGLLLSDVVFLCRV